MPVPIIFLNVVMKTELTMAEHLRSLKKTFKHTAPRYLCVLAVIKNNLYCSVFSVYSVVPS